MAIRHACALLSVGLACVIAPAAAFSADGAGQPATDAAGAAHPPGKLAPRPLYRDPVFNNPTDPVLVYNAEARKWFMYYTQRRGGGIALIHGSKIGVATSDDRGATWEYRGTADITYGQDEHPDDATYWAPEVIWRDGVFHMFLSFVPGIFNDWNHPREIVHLTSTDAMKWDTVGRVDLESDRVIDAQVIQLGDGTWRMFYKDERRPKALTYADSTDLKQWEVRGNAVTDHNGEGPKCIRWQGKYWLIADIWAGQGVWSSDDCTNWKLQDGVLLGNHGDVVVHGDRAWWFYFGGQTGDRDWAVAPASSERAAEAANEPSAPPARRGARGGAGRGLAINVVELKVIDGRLVFVDPAEPTYVDLPDEPEPEK